MSDTISSRSITVAEWADRAAECLRGAGIPSHRSRQDVSLIARWTLGWDHGTWIVRQQNVLEPAAIARLGALIERRCAHEPIAYILGEREFFGRAFDITPDVLIPRPETELLVEAAGRIVARLPTGKESLHVLDIGTGSGCLAVTLALEHPGARMTATDISPNALAVARRNAARHGVATSITFIEASLAGGLTDEVTIIVTNPPYVAERDRESLDRDVRDHEPATALFGGPDGLDVIRALVPAASRALVPGGWLLMEIGAGQANAVQAIVVASDLTWIGVERDLAGIPRIVIAQRPAGSV